MGERWDRDRFMYERTRDQGPRVDDDRAYMRGGRGPRDQSDDRSDRRYRSFDDDDIVRDRRYYGEEPRFMPPRREPGPEYARRPPAPVMEMERERERDSMSRRESPPRRPGYLRRQSSLDTFDRQHRIFHQHQEYPPPARREDVRRDEYRAPPYTPIPLPKARGLPPPRRYPDQGFYDDIKVAEPEVYGDDDFHAYPERVREREVRRTTRRRRERSGSRDSFTTRTRSHRSSSLSSSLSSRSSSSSSSGGTTVRSEYPKKGKTRIPAKLVSKRALIDLGYPFFEEGNTIIVQKALGQDNIDELLKVSEDYKKVEAEINASRTPVAALPAPPPEKVKPPAPAPPLVQPAEPKPEKVAVPVPVAVPVAAPPAQPVETKPPKPEPRVVEAMPPPPPAPVAPVIVNAAPPVQIIDETYIRDVSPSRSSSSSSWDSHSHHHHHHKSALVHRSRSRSRGGREIRAEIKALERELAHRPRGAPDREIVRAERLPDGQLVIFEEKVEKVVEHHKPPRIEKDKKGPPPALMRAMFATLT